MLRRVVVETAIERLSRGTFKKCDMHLHSSSCYSRSYSKDAFFKALVDSDLDVAAVTDHNSIDASLLFELESKLAENSKALIGGVELNVKLQEDTIKRHHLTLGKGSKGEYFHAIVWFELKDATAMSEIVDRLFNEDSRDKGNTDDNDSTHRTMSRKELSALTKGKAIYLEKFQEEAAAIPHFFIPHENKARSLSDYLPNDSPANRDYKDRLFYYSHAMAVEGGEKSRRRISAGIADELRTTVAALLFSDAKTVETIGSRFTWIDFDGDLDSLLLAISDPESRIRTSDKCPEPPQTNTDSFLESVSFNTCVNGDPCAGKTITLLFSPGYNGIVGSRGSGKSLLACLLANRGLDAYSEFVDADSVRFMRHGGIPTHNRPQCLYLGQGELEDIYKGGKYEEIPFLREHISPLKDKAKQESSEAKARLKTLIGLSNKLFEAFCSKYRSGAIRIDHLDTETPSGITLRTPHLPLDDERQIIKAKTSIEGIKGNLSNIAGVSRSISFSPSYAEDDELFTALETEARAVQGEVLALAAHVERFADALGKVDSAWFARRKELVSLFVKTLDEHNNTSGSTTLSQYQTQTREALSFLEDLLTLRMFFLHLDQEACTAYERVYTPIDPKKLKNGDETIEVSLTYDDSSSYEDKVAELIRSTNIQGTQVLAEAFLKQSDRGRMHKLFNGTKFKSCSNKDLEAHSKKFYELVQSAIRSVGNLETRITINDEPINNMSPGMKAQALLKLFLNDDVTSGAWMYIVLDQPEDNLDVATIKDFLIDRLKQLKLNVQFFVVSHSAPVIVNGDARSIVVCENKNRSIGYTCGAMNDSAVKQSIADVLDGGERYLKMRLNKYNFQVGDKQ